MKLQNKFLFFALILAITLAIVFSIIVKAQSNDEKSFQVSLAGKTQEELQTELLCLKGGILK
jgi:hypothetical protein